MRIWRGSRQRYYYHEVVLGTKYFGQAYILLLTRWVSYMVM
jgi:hypothetical protein